MKRLRDSQKSKLYQAEVESLTAGKEFKNLDEVKSYIKKICASQYWKKLNGYTKIIVKDGRGRRIACAFSKYEIALPRWARCERVILHELAHTLISFNNDGIAAHGKEFAKGYLNLVKRFMGNEAYLSLRAGFKKYHVKYCA